MYKNKTVSLILPAYNEEESIVLVINNFSKIKEIDEIIVIDNNSKDKTAELAINTGRVRLVKESKQGYGFAIQRGLKEARGNLLILCDVDNTYIAEDIKKLLKYSNNFDLVFATRVYKKYLLKGSDMHLLRRWANITLSTLISVLFRGPKLTDIGATFRLINRDVYEKIRKGFSIGGGHFQPELTILVLLNGFLIKEVPVYYGPRLGTSKIAGSFKGSIKTAINMLDIILKCRLKAWFSQHSTETCNI